MSPRVVLVGPPGAGKTTVAKLLGELLDVPWQDTDADVEQLAGKPIADVFVTDGEAAFRDLERAAVTTALTTHDGVLAVGGGAFLDPLAQAELATYSTGGGTVVFLDVSLAHAGPRLGLNQARSVLLGNPRAQWQKLMDERRPLYERLALIRVMTDDLTPADVARTIHDALEGNG